VRLAGFKFSVVSVVAQPPSLQTLLIENPGNLSSASLELTFSANGSETSVLNGNSGLPTTGSLSNASGSFTSTWTSQENFDPSNLNGDLSTIVGNKWGFAGDNMGPITDLGPAANLQPGEAIVISFDLAGLDLDPGYALRLDNALIYNLRDGMEAGARFSYRDGSTGEIDQITGTEAEQQPVAYLAPPTVQPLNQLI
jgi:hypothetical protein